MHRTRIKICGLTRPGDVAAACDAGADAVGFVCHPGSSRFVPPAALAALAAAVGPFVTPVLLFVDATADVVAEALHAVPSALLQFHGDESPEACVAPGRPYLRALAMVDGIDLLDSSARFATARALLVDAPSEGRGGSGQVFDWSRLPSPAARSKPLVLAGGLNPGNVGRAIAAVQPWAVDVSTGVESAKGIKDPALMRAFVAAVRAADAGRNPA